MSLSARRAWIEILMANRKEHHRLVALRKESVDRNFYYANKDCDWVRVALRKESVDRNSARVNSMLTLIQSLSARRAWIEMQIVF